MAKTQTQPGNVDWMYIKRRKVSPHRMNVILDILDRMGITRIYTGSKKRITAIYKLADHYFLTAGSGYFELFVSYLKTDKNGRVILRTFRYYAAGTTQDLSREEEVLGKESYFRIASRFEKLKKNKLNIEYGGITKYGTQYRLIKGCVPVQIGWINPKTAYDRIESCYKADVSSAYPWEASKPLPTLNGCKDIPGIHEPDSEYPFAFYPMTGTLKIYGENIDTAELFRRQEYKPSEKIRPHTDEPRTILCKPYEGDELARIFADMYEGRGKHPEYKRYMNLFIGYCQNNNNPWLSHISAVVIARCCFRVLEMADELRRRGNKITLINVDSVAWQGRPAEDLYSRKKYFGAMYLEHENVFMCIGGVKKYQIYDPRIGKTKTMYAGVRREESCNIPFGDILNYTEEEENKLITYLTFLNERIYRMTVDKVDETKYHVQERA